MVQTRVPKTNALHELGYKIFLDRYAQKDMTRRTLAVGDTVIVVVDPKTGQREIGTVSAIDLPKVTVTLREGEVVERDLEHVDKPLETQPEQMMDRVAAGIAAVEATDALRTTWTQNFRWLLDDWKFVPGGRILTGAGTNQELTYYNCYVVPSPQDSRSGIINTLEQMTEIMSRGGGVGINISSLRPRHAYVKGVNGRSSGSVSWGALYSFVTGLIEQGGSRRGALMLILNDWHPDVFDFINSKRKAGNITNANISVGISDRFMEAVQADADWDLMFPDTSEPGYDQSWDGDIESWQAGGKRVIRYKTIKARELWNAMIESAWASAEPGVWFRERSNKMSNSWYFSPLISTNPCVTGDTRVFTSRGMQRISDLFRDATAFDVVIDGRFGAGVQFAPSSRAFMTGVKPVYRLETKQGYSLRATADHRIMTTRGWMELQSLQPGDQIHIVNRKGGFGTGGDAITGAVHGKNLHQLNQKPATFSYRGGGFTTISHEAVTIPDEVFYGTEAMQRAVLEEILESAEFEREPVSIDSLEQKFLLDVQMILANFGVYSTVTTNAAGGYILRTEPDSESFTATVTSITADGTEPVYDLVEEVTHSFVANGLVVHNCGEQPLSAWSVCNLGAINLARFYDAEKHDVAWDMLDRAVRYSVRFLDNVIDSTPYFFEENERKQRSERRVGLGTMGVAELMLYCGVRYGSDESVTFIEKLYKHIAIAAYETSAALAAEKGAFDAFDAEKVLQSGFMRQMPENVRQQVRQQGLRNVTLLTQAPTGTTGTMVNTSTGIEPFFSWVYYRKSRLGLHEEQVPVVADWYAQNPDAEKLPDYFVTAMELSPEEHVRVQGAFQRWIDSAISKTCNVPNHYTVSQVSDLYMQMYELGCKGGTIYRDGSRDEQVLMLKGDKRAEEEMENLRKEEKSTPASAAPELVQTPHKEYPRPVRLTGTTVKFRTPFGTSYITMNNDDNGNPFEVFITVGKAGSDIQADAEAMGRMISLQLRTTAPQNRREMLRLLKEQLQGIGGARPTGFGPNRVLSLPDAVANAIDQYYFQTDAPQQLGLPMSGVDNVPPNSVRARSGVSKGGASLNLSAMEVVGFSSGADMCPECGTISLIRVEGCRTCTTCGYSEC